MLPTLRSLPGVCALEVFRGAAAAADAPPDLLIEVPHGATRAHHFDALRARLRGPFPDDLVAFFHVNTDAGAPELARALAARLVAAEPGRAVLVLASEIPRTFIDCNRVLDVSAEALRVGKVTPGLPPYVRDADDRRLLRGLYDAYVEASGAAYALVCGAGGLGLMAHSYAPRSVDVEVDDHIVASLRRAYAPDVEATWPLRPPIDLIARDVEGRVLGERLVGRFQAALRAAGLETGLSATYPATPSTLAYHHIVRYEGRVLCFEVRRDLLCERFVPFVETVPDAARIARVAAPLGEAVRAAWSAAA